MRRGIHATLSTGLVAVFLCACPAWGQTIIRVSTTGDDVNDGSDWPVAKRTVQAALNAATSGDQVWVAAGTYVERITLKGGVALYGGFAGNETDLSQRNWAANKTILDGNKGGSVVTSPSGATTTTRIDGFTICKGDATSGGGIYCSSSSPAIANNTVTANIASYGGGISCSTFSSAAIVNNTIIENSADSGGGIHCRMSSPTISHNTIVGNGLHNGAGVHCDFASPVISNNVIVSNDGCGVYCRASSPTIANNTITGNAERGIHCTDNSSPMVANTIVAFNSYGVFSESSAPTLGHNCVYGNIGYDYSGMADPTGTGGNISADPGLRGRQYANWHISLGSPCVDAGDDAAVGPDSLDLDGQPRIQGDHVDIGVDESDGTEPSGDPNIIVRVSPDGDDANDGSTWALAKRTVQAGIGAAGAAGGEVWVRSGTYSERIKLCRFVHAYGGFNGTETTRDQRDFVANETILDGQQGGSVVTVQASGDGLSTIDGFTIRNGNASSGGGIYLIYASPVIANNTITCNTASSFGGGISSGHLSPKIVNNRIVGNTAHGGGGIDCGSSFAKITNNTIAENAVSENGGGIFCFRSSPTIANNVITGNIASSSRWTYGGGIECYEASPAISNNTITRNTGEGIYCDHSSPAIVNNTIAENTGSGVSCWHSSAPAIANTILAWNRYGIYAYASSIAALRDNCVYGNTKYNYSGTTDPTGTNGNISVDPRFVNSTADDYHLKPVSPCINAGDPAGDYAGQTDADDEPRVAYGRVDIGADEFLYRGSLDFDLDNDLDLADFGFFAACFAGPNRPYPDVAICSQADLDADNDVDLTDFAAFRSCFNGPNRPPACS